MRFIAFFVFLIPALIYLWNGDDRLSKKAGVKFALSLVFVLVGTIIAAFVMRMLIAMGLNMSVHAAKSLVAAFALSVMTIVMLKFMVMMLHFVFGTILNFHKNYNAQNYGRFSFITSRFPEGFLFPFKILITIGAILIYYGIWFVIAGS